MIVSIFGGMNLEICSKQYKKSYNFVFKHVLKSWNNIVLLFFSNNLIKNQLKKDIPNFFSKILWILIKIVIN